MGSDYGNRPDADYVYIGNAPRGAGAENWAEFNASLRANIGSYRLGPPISFGDEPPEEYKGSVGIYALRGSAQAGTYPIEITLEQAAAREEQNFQTRKAKAGIREQIPEIQEYLSDEANFPGLISFEEVLGPRYTNRAMNLDHLLSGIYYSARYTRMELIEAMTHMDRYREKELASAPSVEGLGDLGTLFKTLQFLEPEDEELFLSLRRSTGVLTGVCSLWGYTAHALRDIFELGSVSFWDVSIERVLGAASGNPGFERLIQHTGFPKSGPPTFGQGSLMGKLRRYRNSMAHHADLSFSSVVRQLADKGEDRKPAISLNDVATGREVKIEFADPAEMLGFAEDAYTHYCDGYSISAGMIRERSREMGRK